MNESELSAASNDAVQVVEFLIQVLPDWARIKVFQYQEFYSSISEVQFNKQLICMVAQYAIIEP